MKKATIRSTEKSATRSKKTNAKNRASKSKSSQKKSHRDDGALDIANSLDIALLMQSQAQVRIGSWEFNVESGQVRWSDELFNIFGMEKNATLTTEDYYERVHPDDREAAFLSVQNAIEHGTGCKFDQRISRKSDGVLRHIQMIGDSVRDATGKTIKLFGTVVDITERKEVEIALRQSQDILAAAVSSNKDWIAVIDRDYRFTVMNEMVRNGLKTEYGVEVQLGHSMLSYVKKGVEKWKSFCDRAFAGEIVTLETQDASDPDDINYFENIFSPIKTANGDVEFISVRSINITERKRAEEKLREANDQFRAVLNAIPGFVSWISRDLQYLGINDQLANSAGMSAEDYIGKKVGRYDKEFEEFVHDFFESEKKIDRREVKLTFTGEERTHLMAAQKYNDGNAAVFVGIDITERKRAEERLKQTEEQLLQAQKMEAIGTLTGGIAHDFNNLLNGISGNLRLLKNRLPKDEKLSVPLERIATATQRAASMTSKLLGFARKGKLETAPVSIAECIATVVELISNSIDKRIATSLALQPQLPNVLGDRNQLEQVFLNLVINARDAIMDVIGLRTVGEIVFGATAETLSPEVAESMQLEPYKMYLHITIADNGAGIPEVIQGKIFEPFFTTKGVGKGTGLGLAMIYGIVKNHAGAVYFESTEGKGTTFHLLLPAETSPVHKHVLPIVHQKSISKNYRLLVIDDEDLVREMLVEALEYHGFDMLQANNGRSGIEVFARQHETINAVILDLNMPDLNGEGALQEMKKINSDVPIIITTGFLQNDVGNRLKQNGATRIVMKPFDTDELSELLAFVIENNVNSNT